MSSSKPTVGFKYFLGMHMVVCHGPVDEVEEIWAGERLAWEPVPGNPATKLTFSRLFFIDKPNLFGGEKKEGGIQGFVNIMMGEDTQIQNDYLLSVGLQVLPAFRGVLSFVLRQVYITAMTPYIKPWWFLTRRIPGQDWYPEKADINSGANGIHILYEAWTNPDWGLGYPEATIDDTNWREAADIIFDQNLSLSMIYARETSIEEFMFLVLSHLNGVMFTDYQTGLQRIKIFTDDYDAELDAFVEFDNSNIISLEAFSRPGYGEVINEVTVVYRNQGATEDSSVTIQDLAIINAQEGVSSQTIQYPGIDTDANASLIAERDLKQLSTPLAKISITVNRTGFQLMQGDVFKFSWSDLGISEMICRVIGIDFGNLNDRTVRIEAVEDIFGLGSTSYIDPQATLWEDPYVNPEPLTQFELIEMPYYFLAQELGEEGIVNVATTSAYGMAFGSKPATGSNTGHVLFASPDINGWEDGLEEIDQASNTTILKPTALMGVADTTFTYDSTTSLDSQNVTDSDFLMMADEFMFIEAIDHGTQLVTVKRGVMDTIPATHVAQSNGYLVDSNFYTFDPDEHVIGDTIYYWVQGRSLIGFDTPSADATNQIDFGARQGKPYPAADVKFDGVYFPTDSRGDFTITWSGRNRLLNTTPNAAIGWFEGAQSPEEGTTYTIQIFDATGGPEVFLEEFTGLEVDAVTNIGTFMYRPSSETAERYAVYIRALRSGFFSEFAVSHAFDVFGYGFDYGNTYGGVEDGIILAPGTIIPPVGNVIPLPAPQWADSLWRSLTSDAGTENSTVSGVDFTWEGGVNGTAWSVTTISGPEDASPRNFTEYGNNIRVDQSTSNLTYAIKRGDQNWETQTTSDISGLYVVGGRMDTITFNYTDNVFVICNNDGRDVITTSDFIDFTVQSDPQPPDLVAPNPVFGIIQVTGILWNGSQYVAAGIVPGTSGFDPATGQNTSVYQIAYTNGNDLLDWTAGDEISIAVANIFTRAFNNINGGYFNGNYFAFLNSVGYKSPDLITWTDISEDIPLSINEQMSDVIITSNRMDIIATAKIYYTTTGTTFFEDDFRFNNVNDLEGPVVPFRGKIIPTDVRDDGPSQVMFRTAPDESVGGKLLRMDNMSSTPSSVALAYPSTAENSNFVGMISRNHGSSNGVYDGSFAINGIDAEAFCNAAVTGSRRYWEVEFISTPFSDLTTTAIDVFQIGIRTRGGTLSSFEIYVTSRSKQVFPGASGGGQSLPITIATGDIFGIELDLPGDRIIFFQNGIEFFRYEVNIDTGANIYPYLNADLSTLSLNVGQKAFEFQPVGTTKLWQ